MFCDFITSKPYETQQVETGRLSAVITTKWGLCESRGVILHTILGGSPVILWISLGGKPTWLPLKFGYHDVMRTSPIRHKTGTATQSV